MTPFALGSAISAAVAGRLVARCGRKLTVTGLSRVITGLWCVPLAWFGPAGRIGVLLIALLLVAGIGGGRVAAPDTTRMAGAAGGALQTRQRIGSAVLAGVYRALIAATHAK